MEIPLHIASRIFSPAPYFSLTHTHRHRYTEGLPFTSNSVPLLQENFGLGAALGLHSMITRPPLAARIFFFIGFSSKVGGEAENKI